jgi:superfamily II DNA or RNA helicase
MSYKLRPYQAECVERVEDSFKANLVKSALVVLPTGTGKTVCFTEMAKREEGRTLIVCPMRELIHQAADKIKEVTGEVAAIEQASNWSDESMYVAKYVVGSKQTLTMKQRNMPPRYKRFRDISLVVVDEAHLSVTKPMIEMLNHFRENGAKIVGVTATPNRTDKLSLQNVYDDCVYSMTLPNAIEQGWLVAPAANIIRVKSMDLSKVAIERGDFSASSLNEVVEQERVELEMADVIHKESIGLKTAVYCSSVAQAEKLAEILSVRYGNKAEFVCADEEKCSGEQRFNVLNSFKNDPNGVMIVANCGILTTGWDFPGLQHVVMARPTKSMSLYLQILGRATRPLPGVVDFAGSTNESRRAAIAASGKPNFKMTDLVDVSLKHKICSSVDALAGDIDEELRASLMSEITDQGPVHDILKKMEELKRRIEEEKQRKEKEEREARERAAMLAEARRKRQIKFTVEYEKFGVDLGDAPGISPTKKRTGLGPVALFGKYKNRPLTEIPLGYLKWKLENLNLIPWYRQNIQRELERRAAAGTC